MSSPLDRIEAWAKFALKNVGPGVTGLQAVAGVVLSLASLWLAYRIYRGER